MRGSRINPEDIVGKRFGSWTALMQVSSTRYRCRCDCGTESTITGYSLVRGKSTRCKRCAARSRGDMDALVGQKFGMLTVLGRCECPPYYVDTSASWFLCRCDCGKQILRKGASLKNGQSYSCGCTRRPRKKKAETGRNEMPEYHVGTSPITGAIYAGKAKKLGNAEMEWITKSEVTNEAINAVAAHLLLKIEQDEDKGAYYLKTHDGRHLRLKLEVSDHKPSWLGEEGEE